MDCGLDYKQEHNSSIIQHFDYLLASLDDSGIQVDDNYDQSIELVQVIQETINKMIIELSLFVSSNENNSIELLNRKRFLVNKFFVIVTNLIQSNTGILAQIQNVDIRILQKQGRCLIRSSDFSFLSSCQLTNLILTALKYFQDDSEPILELLVHIQEIDLDFFNSLFQFQFNILTDYLYNILKTQYLSGNFLQSNTSFYSLIILAKNTDLFINDESILYNFNLLLQDLISRGFQTLAFKNIIELKKYESLLFLHVEMSQQKLFLKGSSKSDTSLSKSRLDILNFLMTLAFQAKNQVFDKVVLNFIFQAMELDENFDFNSFLAYNECFCQFLQQVSSNLLINPTDHQEKENNEEKNNLFTDIDIETRRILLDLISLISISVDSLSDFLCDIFLNFTLNQFYHWSLIGPSSSTELNDIKELAIIAIANLTSITGRITDSIVSFKGVLEDIIEMIDDSSFDTKIHICVIFSNLLFESSQYFDSLISRVNIVEKLKPLIWSTIPSLHREVCTIFLNILMSIQDDGIASSISFELKEEGIFESLSMMLDEDNNTELDKNYIFELSETLNNYLY